MAAVNRRLGQMTAWVLTDQVFPSVDFFFPDDMGIFPDVNAGIQRVQTVKKWFREQELLHTCPYTDWAPQSLALNPAENCWELLGKSTQ